jgi:hypothetical protein
MITRMAVNTEHPGNERGARDRPQRNDDDLGREDEVSAHGALDLVLLDRSQVAAGSVSACISSASCAASSALP